MIKLKELLKESTIHLQLKEKEKIGKYIRYRYDALQDSKVVGDLLLDVGGGNIIIQSINSSKSGIGRSIVDLIRRNYPNKKIGGLSTQSAIGFWEKMNVDFDYNNPEPNYDDDEGDLIPFTLK